MGGLLFRTPAPGTFPALVRLFSEPGADAFSEHFPGDTPEERAARRPVRDGTRRFEEYVFSGETLAAYIILTWYEGYDDPSLGVIVAKDFRTRGLSKVLVDRLLRVASAQGAKTVFLTVRKDNPPAFALYSGKGFVIEGDRGEKWAMRCRLSPFLLQTEHPVVPSPAVLALKARRPVGTFFSGALVGCGAGAHIAPILYAVRITRLYVYPDPLELAALQKEYDVYENLSFPADAPGKALDFAFLVNPDLRALTDWRQRVRPDGMLCGVGGDTSALRRAAEKGGKRWEVKGDAWWA